MKQFIFKYFFPTDNLYIQIGKKKSLCGDDEFQDDIVLFRDRDTSELVGINIMHFTKSKIDRIQTTKNGGIDFSFPFRLIKVLVSLEDIRETEPEEFERNLKIFGYDIRKSTDSVDFKFKEKSTPDFELATT